MTARAVTTAAGIVACLTVSPAGAWAATLEVRPAKPCYGTSDQVSLVGDGFTPSRSVNILRDGKILNRRDGKIQPIVTDARGRIAVVATVPDLKRSAQTSTYTAVDRPNPAIRAAVGVRLSDLAVSIKPDNAAADRPRRIRARGFTAGGRTLYGHVVRGKTRRTFKVGRLEGRCKRASGMRRLFNAKAARGTYRVQFDSSKKYDPAREQRIRFNVTIRRVTGSAAAGLATVAALGR